ncbi:MAG: hypothetical protein ACPHEQ_03450 [Arenicellales bacterium]
MNTRVGCLVLLLPILGLGRVASADIQTANDALDCSAMALVSTLIPPEKVSDITKLPTDYVDAFFGSMHMVSQVYFGIYVVNRQNAQVLPTNRQIMKARDDRLNALSFQYESDPNTIRRLYLLCDDWGKSLSVYLESAGQNMGTTEEEAIQMFRSAPKMMRNASFDGESKQLGEALADAGLQTYIGLGRPTSNIPPASNSDPTTEIQSQNQ